MYNYEKLSRSIIKENFESSVLIQFDKNAAMYFRAWEATPSNKAKNTEEVKTGTGFDDPSLWDPENVKIYLQIAKAAYDLCKHAWNDFNKKEASQLSEHEINELRNKLEEELQKNGITKEEANRIAERSIDNLKEI